MALSLQKYIWPDYDDPLNHLLKERSKNEREKSRLIELENGDLLPENLVIEILSWLPVKDLLQYKSVCKSWYAIISSAAFISKHLINYYNNNDSWRGCLFAQYYVSHAELQLFELLVDETPKTAAYEILYKMPMYASYIQGPCNGIYYLYHYDNGDRALWNPAINQLKVLPPLITKPDLPSNIVYTKYDVYGFGLHPISGDYKVVLIKSYWEKTVEGTEHSSHSVSVLVYSLSTDSWCYWGDLANNYFLENNACHICVNGAFYWRELRDQNDQHSEVIVSFDMVNDACQELQMPDYGKPSSMCLGVYHESIACFVVNEGQNFSIWTLIEGFWTKKFTMEPCLHIRNPVGHWRDNLIILEADDGNLVLCNPETQDLHSLAFMRWTRCKGIYAYMESLVSMKVKNEQVGTST